MSTEILNTVLSEEVAKKPPAELPAVTQSKFFSPAFNAAIFDGPLRIYFAQYQEPEALKIYFYMQEKFNCEKDIKAQLKKQGSNVFILLYPSTEIFLRSFEGQGVGKNDQLAVHCFGKDLVLGLNGQFAKSEFDGIFARITQFALPQV